MRNLIAALVVLATPALSMETRCGWFDNPSPSNWFLTDADGDWTIAVQGRREPSEIFDLEWGGTSEWVETNVHYGFGCACMDVVVDAQTRWVTQVSRVTWQPLAQCHADPALPRRGGKASR